jgi:hypothetical protein
MGGEQIGPVLGFKRVGLILFEESEDSLPLDNPFHALFKTTDDRGNYEQIHSLNPVKLLKFYLCLHPAT